MPKKGGRSKKEKKTNEMKDRLGRLLSTAFEGQSMGCFAGSGPLDDAPDPGLKIEGLGTIKLPLDKEGAEHIISRAEQAPFGKGSKTIVDLSVRRTWQIDAKSIQFENPEWDKYIKEEVISEVAEELGLSSDSIDASLYKLLLYGEGGHFDAHQDTEKEKKMFGTLIIILPSPFTGGRVTASHCSQNLTFDTADYSKDQFWFTCLYSDVFHKVHPVTSGYRLALTYNLISKAKSRTLPTAPVPSKSMLELRTVLEEWLTAFKIKQDAPQFLAHVLKHQYSEDGLHFTDIKGEDRVKVTYLESLAAELGFSMYLAQFDVCITGMGRELDMPEEEEEEDEEWDSYEYYRMRAEYYDYTFLQEAYREYELKSAVDLEGRDVDFKKLELNEEILTPPYDILKDWKIDDTETENFRGNEGGDIHQFYHRTVVLMWPNVQDVAMRIEGGGVEAAVRLFQERISQFKDETRTLSEEKIAEQSADLKTIIAVIFKSHQYLSQYVDSIADVGLMLKDINPFLTAAASPYRYMIKPPTWINAIKMFGFDKIKELLEDMFSSHKSEKNASNFVTNKLCFIIDRIISTFSDEQVITSWANDHMLSTLALFNVYDDDALGLVLKHAKRAGFEAYRLLLEAIIKKLTAARKKSQEHSSYYDYKSAETYYSEIEILVRCFAAFLKNEETLVWCQSKLVGVLGSLKALTAKESLSLAQLLRFCHENDRLSVITNVLEKFQRSSYSRPYLSNMIQPFVQALRLELEKKSVSLQDPPFDTFVHHFKTTGQNVFHEPEPAVPGDFSLKVGKGTNEQLDSFLASSIEHVLNLYELNGDTKARLIELHDQKHITVDFKNPRITVARKVHAIPRTNFELKTLMDKNTQRDWEWIIRKCDDSYEECKKFTAYLEYAKIQEAMTEYFKAFAISPAVMESNDPLSNNGTGTGTGVTARTAKRRADGSAEVELPEPQRRSERLRMKKPQE